MPAHPRPYRRVGALSAGAAGSGTRRRLIVEADGGARGNPGPAAYGAVVRDAATREVLDEVADSIGTATNNVAEYRGLIAGLTAARAIDPEAEVEARLDSKLVVEQMSGRWRIKHPGMRELALEASELLPGRVTFTWVPRERNRAADRLANEALDAAAAGRPWRRGGSQTQARRPVTGEGSGSARESAEAVVPTDSAEAMVPTESADPAAPPAPAAAEPAPALNRLVGWDGDLGTPTTLVLVRHGETELTAAKRFSGSGGADPGLTDRGRWQARRVAAQLALWAKQGRSVDALVTSPLQRTRETAAAIAEDLDLEPRVVDGWRECAFGDWDGCTFAEVRAGWPAELDAWLASTAVAPPGGESYDDLAARVAVVRDRMIARYAGRTVVVVSHGMAIKQVVRMVLEAPSRAIYRMDHAPAAVSVVQQWPDGVASLRVLNDTGHLR